MSRAAVAARPVRRWSASGTSLDDDLVAVERPLEIRVDHGPADDRQRLSLGVTMRTPGHDSDLAVGSLVAEGVVAAPADIASVRPCRSGDDAVDAIRVTLADHVVVATESLARATVTSSACGVCGHHGIGHLTRSCAPARWTLPPLDPHLVAVLGDRLVGEQVAYRHTGGIHAAGVFDHRGDPVVQREDVGRHNALDKVVGRLWWDDNLPLDDHILVLSGRTSFELVQKAARAGIPVVAAIGAPSSLACEVAEATEITLLGFLRPERFNVYTHPGRVAA